MIGYIKGEAVSENVVVAGGVGYVLNLVKALNTGDTAALWVTTVVREDAITLYGFETRDENAVFQSLCKISGVGPSMALAVLRDVGVEGVVSLDPKIIARASGVGAKKAAIIASSLKIPDGLSIKQEAWHEVAQTLASLGFDEKRSVDAARQAAKDGETDEAKLLSMALEEIRK